MTLSLLRLYVMFTIVSCALACGPAVPEPSRVSAVIARLDARLVAMQPTATISMDPERARRLAVHVRAMDAYFAFDEATPLEGELHEWMLASEFDELTEAQRVQLADVPELARIVDDFARGLASPDGPTATEDDFTRACQNVTLSEFTGRVLDSAVVCARHGDAEGAVARIAGAVQLASDCASSAIEDVARVSYIALHAHRVADAIVAVDAALTPTQRDRIVERLAEFAAHLIDPQRFAYFGQHSVLAHLRDDLVEAQQTLARGERVGREVLVAFVPVAEEWLTHEARIRGALELGPVSAYAALHALDAESKNLQILTQYLVPMGGAGFGLVVRRAADLHMLRALVAAPDAPYTIVPQAFPGGSVEVSGSGPERRARWIAPASSLAFAERVLPEDP